MDSTAAPVVMAQGGNWHPARAVLNYVLSHCFRSHRAQRGLVDLLVDLLDAEGLSFLPALPRAQGAPVGARVFQLNAPCASMAYRPRSGKLLRGRTMASPGANLRETPPGDLSRKAPSTTLDQTFEVKSRFRWAPHRALHHRRFTGSLVKTWLPGFRDVTGALRAEQPPLSLTPFPASVYRCALHRPFVLSHY